MVFTNDTPKVVHGSWCNGPVREDCVEDHEAQRCPAAPVEVLAARASHPMGQMLARMSRTRFWEGRPTPVVVGRREEKGAEGRSCLLFRIRSDRH
jgi:hypothetical protein